MLNQGDQHTVLSVHPIHNIHFTPLPSLVCLVCSRRLVLLNQISTLDDGNHIHEVGTTRVCPWGSTLSSRDGPSRRKSLGLLAPNAKISSPKSDVTVSRCVGFKAISKKSRVRLAKATGL